MSDGARHCGMLPVGNAILLGGLLHNPGQRKIVSVAHKRTQMMGYVVVESAGKPAYDRISRSIVSRGRKDVINPVLKLTAAGRKVSAVDGVCGLEYQRHGQAHDHMDQQEGQSNQQRRFPATRPAK